MTHYTYLQKRSLTLSGHRTSVALEKEFWDILEGIAQQRQKPLIVIISEIDTQRPSEHPLSSALRLAALSFLTHKS